MPRGVNSRKPTLLKFLRGTLDPSRHAAEAFQPIPRAELGEPPAHWKPDSVARREWEYALRNCPKGMLRSTDRALLVLFCESCAEYEYCGSMIEEQGMVIRCGRQNELVKQNPYSAIRDHAAQRVRQIGDSLGFNPSARARLHTGEAPPAEGSEWDQMKARAEEDPSAPTPRKRGRNRVQ